MGQNFLSDPNFVKKIVSAAYPDKGEFILEIGPGQGALTEHLVSSGANVTAIELDRSLFEPLKAKFSNDTNFTLIEGDALKIDIEEIYKGEKIKVVANLPYNISTAILQRFCENTNIFSDLVLMFQREVVDRIKAQPRDSERGYLSVLVEHHFQAKKLFDIPPEAFRPRPKIWSSVVRLVPKKGVAFNKDFKFLVSQAFQQKRKTIFNNLRSKFPSLSDALKNSNIDPKRRAETLTANEWQMLFQNLQSNS